MTNYANEHPEYMERFFNKTMEEALEKGDMEREVEKAKKIAVYKLGFLLIIFYCFIKLSIVY